MPAKSDLLDCHCWEQDVAAREVLLQAAAVLFRFLKQIRSSGLEQLEANTAERPAWMFREGIHKRAVVSKAFLSAGPTYSCMGGTDCFRDRMAEQRSPGKQRALIQTHEPKSCKVGLIGSIGARGCHCLLPLCSASSSSEAAILSVVLGGGFSVLHTSCAINYIGFKTCRC